jgi:hypothetical protein
MGRKLNDEAILMQIWPIGELGLSRQKKIPMNGYSWGLLVSNTGGLLTKN